MVAARNSRKRTDGNGGDSSKKDRSRRRRSGGEETSHRTAVAKEPTPNAENEEGEVVDDESEGAGEYRAATAKSKEVKAKHEWKRMRKDESTRTRGRKRRKSRSTDVESDASWDDPKRKYSSRRDSKSSSSKKHARSQKRRRSRSPTDKRRRTQADASDGASQKSGKHGNGELLDTKPAEKAAKPVKKEPTARDLEIARLLKEEEEHPELAEMDSEAVWSLKKAQIEMPSRQCPYLDTIDRLICLFSIVISIQAT
ncbi:unnamed protein product [Gongylonema pulchrum]|uniref:ADP-ribosylation factor-like protein 6-interacting protein 4 n=1 Tax=Gongylonema pulchrum TaxID=637853 RepID=A0A183EDD2_9BILA|nr:unnamed protein product [Gongylonema pulchrum]